MNNGWKKLSNYQIYNDLQMIQRLGSIEELKICRKIWRKLLKVDAISCD